MLGALWLIANLAQRCAGPTTDRVLGDERDAKEGFGPAGRSLMFVVASCVRAMMATGGADARVGPCKRRSSVPMAVAVET